MISDADSLTAILIIAVIYLLMTHRSDDPPLP